MYKEQPFTIKGDKALLQDILFAAQHCRNQNRLFLCDGDTLSISHKRLVTILNLIKQHLPWITRIGTYANTKSIYNKTPEQLAELKDLGLQIAYMGLETGDDQTLKKIQKGADSDRMIAMGKKIRQAGIKLSITVLLGIAGTARSHIHAEATGRVLTAIDPEFVGALSLMLVPGSPLFEDHRNGRFSLPGSREMLEEIAVMIQHTTITNGYFHANHASNYLPIKAKFPQDKQTTLKLIGEALQGKVGLKPEYMRGL